MTRYPVPSRWIATLGLLLIVSGGAYAQTDDAGASVLHTAWGAPDLTGIWDFRTRTPLQRPADLGEQAFWSDEEAAAFLQQTLERRESRALSPGAVHAEWWLDFGNALTEDHRTSLIVDPPSGRIPALTPAAQERQAAGLRTYPVRSRLARNSPGRGPEDFGLGERCLVGFNSGPPITPGSYNNNLMVFQTPDYVVLLTEMVHEARVVPLNGRPHLPDDIRQWLGDSRGYWDGDTLVVDSTNFTDKINSFSNLGIGLGSGETSHVIERFTRVDTETLRYEFTVDEPTTFTRSFTAVVPMQRTDSPIYEYACHEGNRALVGMLEAARAVEKQTGTR